MGMFISVSHIYYAVRDLEESVDFYVGKLGPPGSCSIKLRPANLA